MRINIIESPSHETRFVDAKVTSSDHRDVIMIVSRHSGGFVAFVEDDGGRWLEEVGIYETKGDAEIAAREWFASAPESHRVEVVKFGTKRLRGVERAVWDSEITDYKKNAAKYIADARHPHGNDLIADMYQRVFEEAALQDERWLWQTVHDLTVYIFG